MAEVIAMASIIEDFESQPSKKRKKENDAPAVKTITNYFSPVGKSAEKPFSPPRSNNIMDYFKKTSPAAQVTCPPSQQSKETNICPMGSVSGPENTTKLVKASSASKKPRKRPGRSSKKALAINCDAAEDEDIQVVVETISPVDNNSDSYSAADLGVEKANSNAVSHLSDSSETNAGMLETQANICQEECFQGDENEVSPTGDKEKTKTSSCCSPTLVKTKAKRDSADSLFSPVPKVKTQKDKSVKKSDKSSKSGCKAIVSMENVEQQSQSPSSKDHLTPQTDAQEQPELNVSNTVTVSFQDFLKSQNTNGFRQNSCKEKEPGIEMENAEMDRLAVELASDGEASDRLVVPASTDEEDKQSPTQASPHTLTIQAEIHPISPDHHQELSKAPDACKVASIFTACQRSKNSKPIPPHVQKLAIQEPFAAPPRKSNVVLLEEHLELAVLEADSSSLLTGTTVPKCSQAERKQFMSAFKQVSQDNAKSKLSKGAAKQKQVQQLTEEGVKKGKEEEEEEEDGGRKVGDTNGEGEEWKTGQKPAEQDTNKKVSGKRKRVKSKACESPVAPDTATTPPPPAVQRRGRGRPKSCPSLAATTQDTYAASTEVTTSTSATTPTSDACPTTPKDGETLPQSATPETTGTRRRSARELARKHSTPGSSQSEPRATDGKELKESSKTPVAQGAPIGTPKARHPKKGVYRSLMLSPPDNKGTPIRMKFTRVFSSPGKTCEFEILSPYAKEDMQKKNKKKQQRKAQKLVQKAKAIQQSKQTATEETATVRRSTRRQDMSRKNYCEPEDAIIYVEDDDDSKLKAKDTKAKKQVRSLNEVLGKSASVNKATKTLPVTNTKVAPLFLRKKPQRPGAVISIFDDSSHEASDTSQDDEKFRARREFLKSGLPESFKKQIARTAASREAYTLSCSSFQLVVHVQQTPEGCPLWNLPWPTCARLSSLREVSSVEPRQALTVMGPVGLGVLPALRRCREQCVSGWREDLSEAARHWLLEKIQAANPSFPTRDTFTLLLRRRSEHHPKTPAREAKGDSLNAGVDSSGGQILGGKRKREEKEEEGSAENGSNKETASKRQRSSRREPAMVTPVSDDPPETQRRGRGGRTRGCKGQKEKEEADSKEEAGSTSTPTAIHKNAVPVLDSSSTISTQEVTKEDVMWTEKYQPQHSSEVIGNMNSVRRLHSWLREWKMRADREERKKQQEKSGDANDSWISEGGDGLEEDMLCNTLLITGPTGVGKTAAVYACAQELGFKVFEVNCSSQRSGRQILSQLKEATQSHQVDIKGVNTHKPSFFNSYSTSNTSKPGSSPRKVNSPRRVVSSPGKPQSPRRGSSRRGSLAPTSLANFFKVAAKPVPNEPPEASSKKSQPVSTSPRKRTSSKESLHKAELSSGSPAQLTSPPMSPSTPVNVDKGTGDEQSKRTATSLILFEEVDVIFDDDSGFLAAIKTFMTTTKRPVILTTSDPTFGTSFDGYFDEIQFETPSVECTSSYLRLLCLAENVQVDAKEVRSLLDCTGGDVRQSLLQLQCWVRSGAGALHTTPATQSLLASGREAVAGQSDRREPELPPNDSSLTASLLGLLNIHSHSNLQDFLKDESANPLCWDLLTETGKRGFHPLYSNMELLLPLPSRPLLPPTCAPHPNSEFNHPAPYSYPAVAPTSDSMNVNVTKSEEEASPVKVSSRMRRKKQLHPVSSNLLQSDSDSDDCFLSLHRSETTDGQDQPNREQNQPQAQEQAVTLGEPKRKKVQLTEAVRKRSGPVSLGLCAMADYLDQMSSLDSCLPYQSEGTAGMWAKTNGWGLMAEIRNGLTDEPRVEEPSRNRRWVTQATAQRAHEIWSAVEGLSFARCRAGVEQAWVKVQALGGEEEEVRTAAQEELTLPVSPHRNTFSLTQDDVLCPLEMLQRRYEPMRSVWSTRANASSKMATALDVLPALRTICRSQQVKEKGKTKRRFLHYLDGINLGIPKQILNLLAADFP